MKRRLRTVALTVAAVGVLAGCPSNPSARTVAEDMIDALPDLSDQQRTCLREELQNTPDDQLRAVATGNENANFGPDFDISATSQAFQDFVRRLNDACVSG